MLSQEKQIVRQARPTLLPDMEEAAIDALRNDKFLYGENVSKFEDEFAHFVGSKYAVATGSGSAALQFSVIALGSENRGVITSTFSFIASANAILHAGATPVLGDVAEDDYCLDPNLAWDEALSSRIAALLPVHLYGQPAKMDRFQSLSEERRIPLIEDACQAHGARYKGKRIGSIGNAAAFSFYPTKNMSVLGDGGMVTTSDEEVASKVRKLRDCGRKSTYEHDIIGYTSRMSSVSAAIGRVQLKHLEAWNNRRREVALTYARALSACPSVKLPPLPANGVEPVFHQFVIRTTQRDALKDYLAENGVESRIHYPIPIHLQPIYEKMYGYEVGRFPVSETIAKECLSLPIHPYLTDDEVRIVSENVLQFFSGR